ncbi:adenylate kinase 9 [Lampetra planeri]
MSAPLQKPGDTAMGLLGPFDEDDAEMQMLLSKPLCLLVLGKPGVGKATLARRLTKVWKCVLVEGVDVIQQHIDAQTETGIMLQERLVKGEMISEEMVTSLLLEKLASPQVAHYGYVLCGFPSLSEENLTIPQQIELIKSWSLKPDVIINIKCPNDDLHKRRTRQREDPLTGQVYALDELGREAARDGKNPQADDATEREEEGEEMEEKEEEAEAGLDKGLLSRLVRRPGDSPEDVMRVITLYNDTLLRPLEDLMADHDPRYLIELDGNDSPNALLGGVLARLKMLGLQEAAVPMHLQGEDDLPSDLDPDEVLRAVSGWQRPGARHRWRRSRWGAVCPVALQQGNLKIGKAEFAISFLDKMYLLSSEEAQAKFCANPRSYLMPPQPKPPCHVVVMGPGTAGKTTLCHLLADHYGTRVVNVAELVRPAVEEEKQRSVELARAEALAVALETVRSRKQQEKLERMQALAEKAEPEDEVAKEGQAATEEEEHKPGVAATATEEMEISGDEVEEDFVVAEPGDSGLTEAGEREAGVLGEGVGMGSELEGGEEEDGGEEGGEVEAGDEEGDVTAEHPEVRALVAEAALRAEQAAEGLPAEAYVDVLVKALSDMRRETDDVEGAGVVAQGWVLDDFPADQELWATLLAKGPCPDEVFCLVDPSAKSELLLSRMYSKHKEEVDAKRKQRRVQQLEQERQEANARRQEELEALREQQKEKLEQPEGIHDSGREENADQSGVIETILEEPLESSTDLIMEVEPDPALEDVPEGGFPAGPEMERYYEEVVTFKSAWQHCSAIIASKTSLQPLVINITEKAPREILKQATTTMERLLWYRATEVTGVDLDEEEEDARAEMEEVEAEGEEEGKEEEEQEEQNDDKHKTKRQLGDSSHFCPVALKQRFVLAPGNPEVAAKYRERVYYLTSPEARTQFCESPKEFIAHMEPLQAPPLRIVMLGPRGAGKSMCARWLAEKLEIFHIQFRERLRELVTTGDKQAVPQEPSSDKKPPEDNQPQQQQEVEGDWQKHAEAVEAYLSDSEPLPAQLLDKLLLSWWNEEPFRSRGFLLEGFPSTPDEVQYLAERALFPEVAVLLNVMEGDVIKRLLPPQLDKWRLENNRKLEELANKKALKKQLQEEKLSKRTANRLARQAERRAERLERRRAREREMEMSDEESQGSDPEEEPDDDDDEEENEEEGEEEVEELEEESDVAERIKTELGEKFDADTNALQNLKESLENVLVDILEVDGSRRRHIVQHKLWERLGPHLPANRGSLLQSCIPVSARLAQRMLQLSYKQLSCFGYRDPVKMYEGDVLSKSRSTAEVSYQVIYRQHIYFFSSKASQDKFTANPVLYTFQPPPKPAIPIRLAVLGPPKSGKTTIAGRLAQEYGVLRLSAGEAVRTVLATQPGTALAAQLTAVLLSGQAVPDELTTRCLDVVLMQPICHTHGFVLDGYPLTQRQVRLLDARGIVPVIVVAMQLASSEVLQRGFQDCKGPGRSYPQLDSPQALAVKMSHHQREVAAVQDFYKRQHQNWILMDGTRSKWWLWTEMLRHVAVSVRQIQDYLHDIGRGWAARIEGLCVTPEECAVRLGEFKEYCPVSLALRGEYVCCDAPSLRWTAEFCGHYYKMASETDLQIFLKSPEQFTAPLAPRALPPSDALPHPLTPAQVKQMFPKQVELQGYCPVTYLDGQLSYDCLVNGSMEFAAEYRGKVYTCLSEAARQSFLKLPEKYSDIKLPKKLPPKRVPISLTSLPMLGYLEQGLSTALVKALSAVGCLKPKYPFLSLHRSALLLVAFHLKTLNPRSSEHVKTEYKQRLRSFEECCELLVHLGSTMPRAFQPIDQRPPALEHSMQTFLAIEKCGSKDLDKSAGMTQVGLV